MPFTSPGPATVVNKYINPPYHIWVKVNSRQLVLSDVRTRHFLVCAEYSSTCFGVEFAHILGKKNSIWRF